MSIGVVSVGARTVVGLNARQTGFLLRAGYPAMAESPLADAQGEAVTMGFVPTLDGRLSGPERLAALARPSFEEAVDPIRELAAEVHVVLDEGLAEAPLARRLLETTLRRSMPEARIAVEASGEAAVARLVTAALASLRTRRADAVVIGAVHSDHDPAAIAALEQSGRLFSPENLDARIPGEAAAFFVLMRDADAARRGLAPGARIVGVGTGTERARFDNDVPAHEAFGLTEAVKRAVDPVATEGRTIGWILTDQTFEMWRQLEWQSVFMRVQDVLGTPYYADAPGQRIGYLGAAALPLFVSMAATAWRHGYAPAPLLLALAGSEGGRRAALVLGNGRVYKGGVA